MILPPHDLKAERAVLGSILIDGGRSSLRCAINLLTVNMFYQESHREVYSAMVELGPEIPIDPVTLPDKLGKKMDELGGQSFLASLFDAVGHSAHLRHYAQIVARLYWERIINQECLRLVDQKDPGNIEAISQAVRSRDAVGRDKTESISDIMHQSIERHERNEVRQLYTVGYGRLDDLWGGCLPGEITTWAAAPGVGKSLLMVNIMRHCAENDWPCLMVGTEMSNAELSDRIVSVFGGPSACCLRRGLKPEQWSSYTNTAAMLADMKIRLMDNPEPSLDDIESAIIESKPKVVFIDYLTHCKLPILSKADPMRLRISEFMRRLHSIGRRHGVVIHLASQINRTAYAGQTETAPTMGSLAESSSVEQESNRVVLLWEPPMADAENKPDVRILQAINCKSRESKRHKKFGLMLNENNLRITEIKEPGNEIIPDHY